MRRTLALAALTCALTALFAQTFVPGAQTRTFRSAVDDSDQPYALYLPRTLDPTKKYPLVISLHAEETNHSVNLVQLFGVLATPLQIGLAVGRGYPRLADVDYIVACPFARGSIGYQGVAEKDVYDVLADVERRYPVDEDRVYLTGISMGGGGALWLGLTRPDIWAAVAPVCAYTIPGSEELAPNALDLPIRLFQGGQDPAVPAASSRAWQKRLLDAGAPAEYIEYPGVRHNAWDFAYRDRSIFSWFGQFHRNRLPERVRLVARSYRYASAYWVRIDGFTPGALASIDARLAGKAEAQVETRDVDAFTIDQGALGLPALVTIDGDAIRVKAGVQLSFAKAGGHWRQGRSEPTAKRLGAEGPVAAVVSDRHIYVYGTADDPPAEAVDIRRRTAERAADWAVPPMARPALKLAVKADSAVTSADLADANLVLFGTRQTNSLIARFAGEMPLALNAGAADYGLLLVVPTGERYALVSSGLPWWTGADQAHRGGDRFAPPPFRLLTTFGDFILFRSSLANVAAEGYFDRNWKAPADAAAKMLATGAVTIQK